MSWSQAIVFPQRLQGVSLEASGPVPLGGPALKEALKESYQSGFQAASDLCNAKVLEMRQQMQAHAHGIFKKIEEAHHQLVHTLTDQLPALISAGVWKIVGQQAMPAEVLRARIEHLISDNCPAEEPVEVRLHPQDLAELQGIDSAFINQHPLFKFKSDDTLAHGDCIMETKFGRVDATLHTQIARMVSELAHS